MVDPAEIEVELSGLTVHQLLVKLFTEMRTANGACREHRERAEADMYGDPAHQIPGMKAMIQDHAAYIGRARFVSKLAVSVLSVTGLANLGALIALIKFLAGG